MEKNVQNFRTFTVLTTCLAGEFRKVSIFCYEKVPYPALIYLWDISDLYMKGISSHILLFSIKTYVVGTHWNSPNEDMPIQ